MKPPCYDQETKTDCPKRHAGCHATCPKWAEYEKARNEEYKAKQAEKDADSIAIRRSIRKRETTAKNALKSFRGYWGPRS